MGRVAGQQAAAVAAAEELTKMNMAEMTEEKAEQLKATFEELGTKVGSEAGKVLPVVRSELYKCDG